MPAERKAFLIFIYKDFSDIAVTDDPRHKLRAGLGVHRGEALCDLFKLAYRRP